MPVLRSLIAREQESSTIAEIAWDAASILTCLTTEKGPAEADAPVHPRNRNDNLAG
jgi:hypothetical protein